MKLVGRIFMALLLAALLLPLTHSSVSASKRIYKASLRATNELHTVVDSSASGSLVLGSNADGTMQFTMSVRGLSGPVTGAHLHGPATDAQNASVMITLCGSGPGIPVVATCTTVDGMLVISGSITPTILASRGIRGVDLLNYLDSGLVYVNVHTALNPSGETRGQLISQ